MTEEEFYGKAMSFDDPQFTDKVAKRLSSGQAIEIEPSESLGGIVAQLYKDAILKDSSKTVEVLDQAKQALENRERQIALRARIAELNCIDDNNGGTKGLDDRFLRFMFNRQQELKTELEKLESNDPQEANE